MGYVLSSWEKGIINKFDYPLLFRSHHRNYHTQIIFKSRRTEVDDPKGKVKSQKYAERLQFALSMRRMALSEISHADYI